MHIVFLELIIDPACSIVFEAEAGEAKIMRRPPRDAHESLFNKQILKTSLSQGGIVFIMVLIAFGLGHYFGYGEARIRALTFSTLVLVNLGLIFTNRSWSRNIIANLRAPNSALWWIISGALIFLALVLYVPLLRSLFHFNTLHLLDLTICFALGIFSILSFEVLRIFNTHA